MANLLLSIALFAGVLLLLGAYKRWQSDGTDVKMCVMLMAALVIFANIAIWVVPDDRGQSLVTGAKNKP